MSSKKNTIRLIGAVMALAALALAVSCQGFFPKATLTSITLAPTAPQFDVGFTQDMQAWGTDSNNNRYQLTSGVTWSLSNPSSGTVATIDQNTGAMLGVNAGTITVTANDQGLSGSATATVVEVVTSMRISPTSGSTIDDGVSFAAFAVYDQNNNDISGLGGLTLTAYPYGTTTGTPVTGITCTYVSTDSPPDFQCVATSLGITTTTNYTLLVAYAGYTGTAITATLSVSP